ncbi:MAG: RNB domain-containing ribonuclease, partial [Candidatus Taylorbacteria bacterium]|nr:RNB domain-containing ribonuclease [Candidatus Taylorbacteria bacterium]
MKNTKNHREENKKNKILKGTIRAVRGNVAYFYSEQGILEAEISTRLLNTAMAGDSVEIKTFGKSKGGKPEGEVIKIIKRAKNFFVGTIEKTDKMTLVIPDDRKMKTTIEIEKDKTKNLNNGDKVKVRITKWNQYPNNSIGEIINILGKKGENSAEMHSIAIDKGFEVDFPEKVTEEANKIFQTNKTVPQEEYSKRKDLRNTLTFTIDPKTAKDFDDAISFKKLDNGNFEIGVHIADVSHYVTEKSELDKEAYKRGCSVYLPDRTIPMLPFELSDNLCSLNEGEEKLAFSAIFEMDSKAKVHSKWFGKSIIKSAKRFTYESAQEVIDSGSPLSLRAERLPDYIQAGGNPS